MLRYVLVALCVIIMLLLLIGLSACGNDAVKLSEAEPDGGRSVPVEAFVQEGTIDEADQISTNEEMTEYLPPTSIEVLIETNPIDIYFSEKAQLLVPTSTFEMVYFGAIAASAWFAEMENNYEILKSSTNIESVRERIDTERHSFIEYIRNRAELEVLLEASTAFEDGEEFLVVGSIGRVFRPSFQGDGWRSKTIELFDRLDSIGIAPQFIFDAEKYDEELRQAFPELWNKVCNDFESDGIVSAPVEGRTQEGNE